MLTDKEISELKSKFTGNANKGLLFLQGKLISGNVESRAILEANPKIVLSALVDAMNTHHNFAALVINATEIYKSGAKPLV